MEAFGRIQVLQCTPVSEGLKLLKITKHTTIGQFKSISTPPNLDFLKITKYTTFWQYDSNFTSKI